MLNRPILLLSLLLSLSCFTTSMCAADVPNEYNVWRLTNGVLYDTTQTENNEPVFVSIIGPGTHWSSIVISFMGTHPCGENKKTAKVWINQDLETLNVNCMQAGDGGIVSYTISDVKKANALYAQLVSGFTVVIDKRIKIWAANIREPK